MAPLAKCLIMDSAATAENDTLPRRRRLRFSLLSLLIVVTLVCVVFGLFPRLYPRRGCAAVASFNVSAQPATLDPTSRFDPLEFEVFKRSQISIIKGQLFMQAVLREPAIGKLPMLANRSDPVAWLSEKVQVNFPQQGEILTISMEGRRNQVAEVKLIVNAVAKT